MKQPLRITTSFRRHQGTYTIRPGTTFYLKSRIDALMVYKCQYTKKGNIVCTNSHRGRKVFKSAREFMRSAIFTEDKFAHHPEPGEDYDWEIWHRFSIAKECMKAFRKED